jgi:UDP-2,3-diacylglucosamine hydrolase
MRTQSESQKQSGVDYADADPALSLQWLAAGQSQRLIHGHTHRPANHPLDGLPTRAVRQVLSDWSLDHAPFRAQVLRLHADGRCERIALS